MKTIRFHAVNTMIMKLNSLKYFVYILIGLSLIITGCSKDWLNEKADKQLKIPETINDFQLMMDDIVSQNQLFPYAGEIAAENHYVSNAVYNLQASNNLYADNYIWSKTRLHVGVHDWIASYAKILLQNIVIEGLKNINPKENEAEQWQNVMGQALMNRARMFFELSQLYSPPFDSSIADQPYGIVLKINSDITERSVRSTIGQTYNQIIMDLKEAIGLLPERPLVVTRGSKAAAAAILSRVYLSMNDYANALVYSNKCLDIKSTLIDYNNFPISNINFGRYNEEVIYHSNFGTSPFLTSCRIDVNFRNLYDINDRRRVLFFRSALDGTIAFKGNYDTDPVILFNGLATDELYLNKAECLARLNRTDEAMTVLNILMKTRWNNTVPFPTITATNPEDALRIILVERNKELILRGTRWMDLRRLNKDPRLAVTLTRIVNGITYRLEPNSLKYALPIPDDILEQSGMEQNPGWK